MLEAHATANRYRDFFKGHILLTISPLSLWSLQFSILSRLQANHICSLHLCRGIIILLWIHNHNQLLTQFVWTCTCVTVFNWLKHCAGLHYCSTAGARNMKFIHIDWRRRAFLKTRYNRSAGQWLRPLQSHLRPNRGWSLPLKEFIIEGDCSSNWRARLQLNSYWSTTTGNHLGWLIPLRAPSWQAPRR